MGAADGGSTGTDIAHSSSAREIVRTMISRMGVDPKELGLK